MRTFETGGHHWEIHADYATLKRIKTGAGVSLFDNGMNLPTALDELVDVLWFAVLPQAQTREVSPEEFGESLCDGDALEKAADVLTEEVADFFFRRGKKEIGDTLLSLWKASKQLEELATKALAKVDSSLFVASRVSPVSTPTLDKPGKS